jgi:hypothetical protein
MNESLRWLDDAAVAPALPGLLSGLVDRLRRVLASGWPAHERIAAITEELAGLAPPPPPPPDFAGPVTGQAAIARLLATSTSPATMLFSEIAGAPVTFAVWTSADSVPLTGWECAVLHADPGTLATTRRGTFALDGRVLADVSSTVITGRLPSEAVASLQAGTPLGAVIAATGRREPTSVLPWGDGLEARAVMWTQGHSGRRPVRIAMAAELVHGWFCARPLPAEVEWRARELCFGVGRDEQEVVAVPVH